MKKLAINGFGRIGRLCMRLLADTPGLEVVAVNDLTDAPTLAHLLMHDSVHGKWKHQVKAGDNALLINGKTIKVLSHRNPAELPWAALKVDAVIEATGLFTSAEKAQLHLEAGARKVIITAPADGVKTIVLGVNDHEISMSDRILSNASCTTNCLAPMARVLDENFGLVKGYITTVHAYTADQRLHDAPHKDLRRARAAALNIVPTSTGAARAVGEVLPSLQGKLDGVAVRVPVPDGSLTDLVAILGREVSRNEVNEAFRQAAQNQMKGILQYCTEPLVSVDVVGNAHSCIFDAALTSANGTLVKVMGWYDNEWAYSARVIDLLQRVI